MQAEPDANGYLEGGFADPVMGGQTIFRAIMQAMAEPGTIRPISQALRAPAPMTRTMAAIAATLCDADTPVWLDDALAAAPQVIKWLGFHTGAPMTPHTDQAAFALVSDSTAMPQLAAFAQGSDSYPDRSSTVILAVESLASGDAFDLSGPGIRTSARLRLTPAPADFIAQWTANGAQFPCGVDLILAAPDAVACLPRTTRIRQGEG
ncbi:MAG: phosphonate C-P lyase system protein PhnH [Minwuia sp.]|nr:phosphonate C-P lyase system protein PhnH [Minwuia sp.]